MGRAAGRPRARMALQPPGTDLSPSATSELPTLPNTVLSGAETKVPRPQTGPRLPVLVIQGDIIEGPVTGTTVRPVIASPQGITARAGDAEQVRVAGHQANPTT